MTVRTRRRRPRAAALAVALATAAGIPAVGGVTGVPPTAVAATPAGAPAAAPWLGRDSVGAASAKVRRLLARVQTVSGQVQAVEQRYAAALGQVAAGVNEAISADRGEAAVQGLLSASEQRLQRQVLVLYASGGSFATSASLLSPNGFEQYAASTHAVSSAVAQTVRLERQQRTLAAAASRQASLSSRRANRSIATERNVAGVARRVQALLARQRTLLGEAQRELAQQKALAAQRAALAAEAAQLTSETAQFSADTSTGVTEVGVLPPSAAYLNYYKKAAATCPGLPWTVLASIGQVESGHGRNDGPSSAGALGPMQFEPATFATYAVDGDHDGKAVITDPADAIFTAAHYLCSNGAGRGPRALANAVFDYNHAAWYVELVLGLAQKYDSVYG